MSDVKMDFYYCPRCLDFQTRKVLCNWCNTHEKVKSEVEYIGKTTINEKNDFLRDPARKQDPRFDQEAYDRRVSYVPIQYEDMLEEMRNIMKPGGGSYAVVSCPYCQSKNTRKISTGSKALNTAMFGIFGNKRKYQWHCNQCGSDF